MEYYFINPEASYITDEELNKIRELGFPYYQFTDDYLKLFLKLRNLDLSSIVHNIDGQFYFKRITFYNKLATVFFPHMYTIKVKGAKKTPMEAFYNDKFLRKAIRLIQSYSLPINSNNLLRKLTIVLGTQCVANFRPDVALYMYNYYGNQGKVLDLCMGFGGRLVGFLASNCTEYIGTDVNTMNNQGYDAILSTYNIDNKTVHYFNTPAEEFLYKENYFDFVFTSPPYFSRELYSNDALQSCIRYNTFESWVQNFLYKLIDNSIKATIVNGYIAINIADVRIYTKYYPLATITKDYMDAQHNLQLERIIYYSMPQLGKSTGKGFTRNEPILIYKKIK